MQYPDDSGAVTARPTTSDDHRIWRDELASTFAGLCPEPLTPGPMMGAIASAYLDDLAAFRVRGTPQIVRRTRSATRRNPSEKLKVCLQVTGRAIVHQDGRELVIGPGQLGVYDTARPYDLRLEGNWDCAVMTVRADDLELPRRWLGEAVDRVHDASRGPGSALASYVSAAVSTAGAETPTGTPGRAHFAAAGLYLLSSVLSSNPEPEPALRHGETMKAAVLGYIRRELHNPTLCHTSIARTHGMSPRSLDRLFADEDESVVAHIRNARLDGARRDIQDPRSAHTTIGALAARWCFVDPAHFSRAYRARFGVAPSADRPAGHR